MNGWDDAKKKIGFSGRYDVEGTPENTRPDSSPKLWGALLAGTLCQAPCALNQTMRFDSDQMLINSERTMEEWISGGRFGLVAVKRLLGLTGYHPLKSGLLFLLFFMLSAWILTTCLQRFAGKRDLPFLKWFPLLYGSCPIWAFQTYFNLQIAEIGFMLAVCAVAAGLSTEAVCAVHGTKTRLLLSGLSGCLLVACLASYQSFAVFYIAVVAMFCTVCLNGIAPKAGVRQGVLLVLHFVLFTGAYLLICRLFFPTDEYLTQQMLWGKASVAVCLINVCIEAAKMCLLYSSGQFSFFPVGVLFLLTAFFLSRKREKARPLMVLCVLLLLLSPLMMSMLLGNRTVPRRQFALQVVAAFLPVMTGDMILRKRNCGTEDLRAARLTGMLRMACAAFVLIQVVLGLRLLHTDRLRDREDLAYAEKVTEALAPYRDSGKPIVFLGAHFFDDDSFLLEKTDVYGNSFFEWMYDETQPFSCDAGARRYMRYVEGNAEGYPEDGLTEDARKEAEQLYHTAKNDSPEEKDAAAAAVPVMEGTNVIAVIMR